MAFKFGNSAALTVAVFLQLLDPAFLSLRQPLPSERRWRGQQGDDDGPSARASSSTMATNCLNAKAES
jgi:hypothetical protein